MSLEKCFCHLNGYKVKDADAHAQIASILAILAGLDGVPANVAENARLLGILTEDQRGLETLVQGHDVIIQQIKDLPATVAEINRLLSVLEQKVTDNHTSFATFSENVLTRLNTLEETVEALGTPYSSTVKIKIMDIDGVEVTQLEYRSNDDGDIITRYTSIPSNGEITLDVLKGTVMKFTTTFPIFVGFEDENGAQLDLNLIEIDGKYELTVPEVDGTLYLYTT